MILTVEQAIERLKTIAATDTLYISWFEMFEVADEDEITQQQWIKALNQTEDEMGRTEDQAIEILQQAVWDLQGGHQ